MLTSGHVVRCFACSFQQLVKPAVHINNSRHKSSASGRLPILTAETRNVPLGCPCDSCVGMLLVHSFRLHFRRSNIHLVQQGTAPRVQSHPTFKMQTGVREIKCTNIAYTYVHGTRYTVHGTPPFRFCETTIVTNPRSYERCCWTHLSIIL
jgi:hypothetical protein